MIKKTSPRGSEVEGTPTIRQKNARVEEKDHNNILEKKTGAD